MNVVFVSNFMNHHQLPVALEMSELYNYKFIATQPIANEQLNMGYEDMNKKYDFILRSYDGSSAIEDIKQVILDADVVIFGSCDFTLVEERIKQNKLTFRYSERLFKNWTPIRKALSFIIPKYFKQCTKYRNKDYYLLCASAYAAKDYQWYGAFKNKAFKWGYFTENKIIDADEIITDKENNSKLNLLWCNRLVKYKHPEMAIFAAKYLRDNNIDFVLNIVGTGPLKSKIEGMVKRYNLEGKVNVIGSVPSSKIRDIMLKTNVSLLTADKGEGWGAVVNESMNACCAVLCNKNIGSVPFLVQDGESGLIYKTKKEFLTKLKEICLNKQLRLKISKNAYLSTVYKWSASNAVKNFDILIKCLKSNQKIEIKEGPCSKA